LGRCHLSIHNGETGQHTPSRIREQRHQGISVMLRMDFENAGRVRERITGNRLETAALGSVYPKGDSCCRIFGLILITGTRRQDDHEKTNQPARSVHGDEGIVGEDVNEARIAKTGVRAAPTKNAEIFRDDCDTK